MNPEQAVELYLDHRESELSHATIQSYEYRLDWFLEWCDEEDVGDTEEIEADDVRQIRAYREEPEPSKATLKAFMDTLRSFLDFLETYNHATEDLHRAAESPSLSGGENVRDDEVTADVARAILERLDRFEYASRKHALVLLLWRTGFRTGSILALDTDDYHPDEQYLAVKHRPEASTPLKNAESGERMVALSEESCEVLSDYIQHNRIEETDEHGRDPLLTTPSGRIARNTVRKWSYRLTRPCWYEGECPHNRELSECRGSTERNDNYAYECPSSVSAHAWRRGAITHFLREDLPEKVVSDRANVSQEVLDKHYDKRTEREKMEQRREFFQ